MTTPLPTSRRGALLALADELSAWDPTVLLMPAVFAQAARRHAATYPETDGVELEAVLAATEPTSQTDRAVARRIVAAVLRDLDGRGGFDGWWGDIDTDVQAEIRRALRGDVEDILRNAR